MKASFDPCQVVKEFCQAWQNKDYKYMFIWVSSAQKACGEKAFVDKYKSLAQKGAVIIRYAIFMPVIIVDKQTVKVEAEIEFQKESPPDVVSGIRIFRLTKELDSYRIDEISAPVLPPFF